MKKKIILLLMICFVFVDYAGDGSRDSDGSVQLQKWNEQFLKSLESTLVSLAKCTTLAEVELVGKQFDKAKNKMVQSLFILYKKYPNLIRLLSRPKLKTLSAKLKFIRNKYEQLYRLALQRFKVGNGSASLEIKKGLSNKQALALVIASFNKAVVGFKAVQSGKQAAQVLMVFLRDLKKIKRLYPDLKGVNSSEIKKASQEFVSALTVVSMKYSTDKDFKKAFESMRGDGK